MKRRKQKPSSDSATGRSGLPSPDATESAEARDQQVAHDDFGRGALRRPVRHRGIDRHRRRLAGEETDAHLLAARPGEIARLSVALVEHPGACGLRRRTDQPHLDAIIGRREIRLALAVALAGIHQGAHRIDAQIRQQRRGPAASVGLGGHLLLGGKHGFQIERRDVAQEILLAPEQAEAVLHLPDDAHLLRDHGRQDLQRPGRRRLRGRGHDKRRKAQRGER